MVTLKKGQKVYLVEEKSAFDGWTVEQQAPHYHEDVVKSVSDNGYVRLKNNAGLSFSVTDNVTVAFGTKYTLFTTKKEMQETYIAQLDFKEYIYEHRI